MRYNIRILYILYGLTVTYIDESVATIELSI